MSKKPGPATRPDAPFAHIIAGATSEDEQLRALDAAAQHAVTLPAAASVVGAPVTAVAIGYRGHPRAGLTLSCVRDGRRFRLGLADAVFPDGSQGARFVSLYRAWLGIDALEPAEPVVGGVGTDGIVGERVELVVLACRQSALRCRVLGTTREVTLRTSVRDEVPGSVLVVTPTRQWTHARHPYLSGTITGTRVDAAALGLTALALHEQGDWDPEEEDWGAEDEPIEDWARPIIARGKRPMFEMEQIIPDANPEDFEADPILAAVELCQAGDRRGARDHLMKLLAKDLRCLDAHAHLGNLEFDRRPQQALAHYAMGTAIGAHSLGQDFAGVLPWGFIDNRPFLRCLHGVGLCAWRLGDLRTAKARFTQMLWLNPRDNQGARFNLAAVTTGKTWADMADEEP